MKIFKRFLSYPFLQLVLLIVSVMFLLIVMLTLGILTSDCNCEKENTCQSLQTRENTSNQQKLAVLVPYRERFEELLIFAPYIHNFLNKQNVTHDIFILNQVDFYRFNRASLINVGYLETRKNYTYVVMHDVDLLPLNRNLSYKYPEQPFHLAAPNLHPRYHYEKFIGGILLMNMQQFESVNGLSNRYWGWGLEDDEFYLRLKDANLTVLRPAGITTGTNNTFRHIHGKERKRDTVKCYNQREVTRRRDRKTGLHDIQYKIKGYSKLNIDGAPLTIINIQLICDHVLTPWCDCTPTKTESKKTTKK